MPETQKSNSLIEQQLEALADICCQAIQPDEQAPEQGEQEQRIQSLIDALVTNGFARMSQEPLNVRVEAMVEERCPEAVLSRKEQLTAMTAQMQNEFESAARQHSAAPPESGQTHDDVTTGAR